MRWRVLVVAVLGVLAPAHSRADAAMDAKIEALVPDLEAYIEKGMEDFHVPGLAVGIVSGDRLVWSKGFGVAWEGGPAVDADSVFQIGSTTKAFLATTFAIGVDRGNLAWDDRVVDLDPDFQLKDPWVTREFRVFDLMAQRSGLPPTANDLLGFVGFDEAAMVRSLRHVEPTTSFRSAFTYTNITHILAGQLLARQMGAPDWATLVRDEIFGPLGMTGTSLTAEAMEAAAKGTRGYLWTADKPVEVPFTPAFPYAFAGAGAINSTVTDMAKWLRLQLAAAASRASRSCRLRTSRSPRRRGSASRRRSPTAWAGCCSRRRTGKSPGTTAEPPRTAPSSAPCSTATSGSSS